MQKFKALYSVKYATYPNAIKVAYLKQYGGSYQFFFPKKKIIMSTTTLMVFSKTVLPNECTCEVLYATIKLLCTIISVIYAAPSFCNRMRYYKTGVNRVVHFAELVNTYICVRKIIVLTSCFIKTAQYYDRRTKTNLTFVMTGIVPDLEFGCTYSAGNTVQGMEYACTNEVRYSKCGLIFTVPVKINFT